LYKRRVSTAVAAAPEHNKNFCPAHFFMKRQAETKASKRNAIKRFENYFNGLTREGRTRRRKKAFI
jgi:hypothetical protein